MKKGGCIFLLMVTVVMLSGHKVYAQANKPFKYDTVGLAAIESAIEDFKPFVQSAISKINQCGSLDSIRMSISPTVLLGDTLLNQIARIYNGFYALHPQQYIPLENISDDLDHIMNTNSIGKAKKYGLKMQVEYDNLLKAK